MTGTPHITQTSNEFTEQEKLLLASFESVQAIAKDTPLFRLEWRGLDIYYKLMAVHIVGNRGVKVLELTLQRAASLQEQGYGVIRQVITSDKQIPADQIYTKASLATAIGMTPIDASQT